MKGFEMLRQEKIGPIVTIASQVAFLKSRIDV